MKLSAKDVVKLIRNNATTELSNHYKLGNLSGVKWHWVTRSLKTHEINLSEEKLYFLISGLSRPNCIICKKLPSSRLLSFNIGYNKYCGNSCAKKDPNTEIKKQQTLNSNPNWKEIALAKSRETCVQKYGVESVMKCSSILEKRKSTNLSKYGSEEVLSSKSSIRHIITNEIGAEVVFSRLSRYTGLTPLFCQTDFTGVKNKNYLFLCNNCQLSFSSSLDCGMIPKCPTCNPPNGSSGEIEVLEFIRSILPDEQIKFRFKIDKNEIDIFIPSKNIGIEYNGLYWHSEQRGRDKMYHLNKKKVLANNNIRLIQFWDIQWLAKKDIVKSIISASLNISKKIYARTCTIKIITEKQSKEFLDENHLSGNASGAVVRLGIFSHDKLLQVATFSKPRFKKAYSSINEFELLRLCSAKGHTIVGGASKLIKHFIKCYNPEKIISFCDEMVYNGNSYLNMGFVKTSDGKPATWYFDRSKNKLIHRFGCQKHKLLKRLSLSDSKKTEWELAQDLNLNRVWDCGGSKWELDVVLQ